MSILSQPVSAQQWLTQNSCTPDVAAHQPRAFHQSQQPGQPATSTQDGPRLKREDVGIFKADHKDPKDLKPSLTARIIFTGSVSFEARVRSLNKPYEEEKDGKINLVESESGGSSDERRAVLFRYRAFWLWLYLQRF